MLCVNSQPAFCGFRDPDKRISGEQPDNVGIGLSIAIAIISSHNGKIWATTRDGRSMERHMQLPL